MDMAKKRKFRIGENVIIYPNVPSLRSKGKIIGYQSIGYWVRATSGTKYREFGNRPLTMYDFELRKMKK